MTETPNPVISYRDRMNRGKQTFNAALDDAEHRASSPVVFTASNGFSLPAPTRTDAVEAKAIWDGHNEAEIKQVLGSVYHRVDGPTGDLVIVRGEHELRVAPGHPVSHTIQVTGQVAGSEAERTALLEYIPHLLSELKESFQRLQVVDADIKALWTATAGHNHSPLVACTDNCPARSACPDGAATSSDATDGR